MADQFQLHLGLLFLTSLLGLIRLSHASLLYEQGTMTVKVEQLALQNNKAIVYA